MAKREFLFSVGFLALASLGLASAMLFIPKSTKHILEFRIQEGESVRETSLNLQNQRLIYDRKTFIIFAHLLGYDRDFKSGRYLINRYESAFSLIRKFYQGKAESDDISVTIPEGENVADIGEILFERGLIERKEDFLKPDILAQEGRLFPDTYRFKKGATAGEIAKRMNDNFSQKTADLFVGLTDKHTSNAIIIASILEKEVRTRQDMELVAGIIEKRVKLKIFLQIDSTLAYGVCRPEFTNGRYCDVSKADIVDNLKKKMEYNTYAILGLPPGPISNSGLNSLSAALNPKSSSYLFYLSAPEGQTIFSKTGAEHLAARKKYLGF